MTASPLPPSEQLEAVAVSPDGRLLAARDSRRTVFLWDAASGALRWRDQSDNHRYDLAFSADSERLFILDYGGVSAWDVATGERLASWKDDRSSQSDRLALSADRSRLLAHIHDRLVLLDAADLSVLARWGCGPNESDYRVRYHDADLHPSGDVVALVQGEYGAEHGAVFRVGQDEPLATFERASRLRFNAAGDRLLIMNDEETRVLPWPPASPRQALPSLPSFRSVERLPGALLLYSRHGMVSLQRDDEREPAWDTAYYEPPEALAAHPEGGVFYSTHGSWIARRSLEDGRLLGVLPSARGYQVTAAALDPETNRLVVGDREGRIQVWDLDTWRRITLADPSPSQPDEAVARKSLGEVKGLLIRGETLWAVCYSGLFGWRGWRDIARPPDERVDLPGSVKSVTPDGEHLVAYPNDGEGYIICALPGGAIVGRIPRLEGYQDPTAGPRGELLFRAEDGEQNSTVEAWSSSDGGPLGVLEVDGSASLCAVDASGAWLEIHPREEWNEEEEEEDEPVSGEGPFMVRWDPRASTVEEAVSPSVLERLGVQGQAWQDMAFLGDGLTVMGNHRSGISLVDLAAGSCALELTGRDSGLRLLHRSGDRLITGDCSGEVRVWSLAERRCVGSLGSGPHGSWWTAGPRGLQHEQGPMGWRTP